MYCIPVFLAECDTQAMFWRETLRSGPICQYPKLSSFPRSVETRLEDQETRVDLCTLKSSPSLVVIFSIIRSKALVFVVFTLCGVSGTTLGGRLG